MLFLIHVDSIAYSLYRGQLPALFFSIHSSGQKQRRGAWPRLRRETFPLVAYAYEYTKVNDIHRSHAGPQAPLVRPRASRPPLYSWLRSLGKRPCRTGDLRRALRQQGSESLASNRPAASARSDQRPMSAKPGQTLRPEYSSGLSSPRRAFSAGRASASCSISPG